MLHKIRPVQPKNVREALQGQDLATLYEIRDTIDRMIADRETERTPDRETLEVRGSGSVTYRLERVSCGKGCKGCPHGPYWYAYWKENGRTRSKYIGKKLR